MNKVIVTGRLTADPESRKTQSGISQCTMRIAVQRRVKDASGNYPADFFTIVAWRQTAESCAQYLSKGRMVAVEGSLQTRSYEAQDGSKRNVTEIIADHVEFIGGYKDNSESTANAEVKTEPAPPTPLSSEFTDFDDDELPF